MIKTKIFFQIVVVMPISVKRGYTVIIYCPNEGIVALNPLPSFNQNTTNAQRFFLYEMKHSYPIS